MAEFAPDLEQPLHKTKLQEGLEPPQFVHIQRDMLLYGTDENQEGVLPKFLLHRREISADNKVGTRDKFRAAGAYSGKGSGVAKSATKRRSDAMQQAAIGEQAFDPSSPVVWAKAAIKLAYSESSQKALSRKKARGLSINLGGPIRHLGQCAAAAIDLLSFRRFSLGGIGISKRGNLLHNIALQEPGVLTWLRFEHLGFRLPVIGRLQFEHFRIAPALAHQFRMAALFNDRSILEHKNLVRHSHRGEPVRDEERHL